MRTVTWSWASRVSRKLPIEILSAPVSALRERTSNLRRSTCDLRSLTVAIEENIVRY